MSYTTDLEEMITNHLLPTFNAYYNMVKEPKPELDEDTLNILRICSARKVPALLKKKERTGCCSWPRTA